jgi:signal transduction histidine kinase
MQTEMNAPDNHAVQEPLLSENARLRGDLLTIARRFCHDLRTPLGGIISTGEALQESLLETDPAALPLVAASLNSAEELSQLIKRVSFVIKATARPCVLQTLPMGAAVSAALQRLESSIIKSGAVITEPEVWPEVTGVSDWLESVWWNLLANALQHAGPSPRIELGWRKENGAFQFWISDHGPGVPEEQRARLFQPFHTLHEPEAARGLGLSIVQRLVELQGGDCAYQPNPQGGARFGFVLR